MKTYTYKYPLKNKIENYLFILLEVILVVCFFKAPYAGLIEKIFIVFLFIIILFVLLFNLSVMKNNKQTREIILTENSITIPIIASNKSEVIMLNNIVSVKEQKGNYTMLLNRPKHLFVSTQEFGINILQEWMNKNEYEKLSNILKTKINQ